MDKNERMTGSDPEKELNEISFKDYHHWQVSILTDMTIFVVTLCFVGCGVDNLISLMTIKFLW